MDSTSKNIEATTGEPRALLLRETAEIALTEIKRTLEPLLCEAFGLRRVSAPLYLPADSGLNGRLMPTDTEGDDNDPQWMRPLRPVRFTLGATGQEVEVVTGLDRWLREQLRRYDIAPGFGVYTVCNALIPDEEVNATHSPHLATWAWQQAAPAKASADKIFGDTVARLYEILYKCEQRVLALFPHLPATLPQRLDTISAAQLRELSPEATWQQRVFQYMHGDEHTSRHCALAVTSGVAVTPRADILVWNDTLHQPLRLADVVAVAQPPASLGGNIYRDRLALQLLHQLQLLSY